MKIVTWFEIPVFDIQRAVAFYNAVCGLQLVPTFNESHSLALFPADDGFGGALVAGPGCVPSETGVLTYLNAGANLDGALERVVIHGGRVALARTLISESAGWFALFIDTEGNRLALLERPMQTTFALAAAGEVAAATPAQGADASSSTPAGSEADANRSLGQSKSSKKRSGKRR